MSPQLISTNLIGKPFFPSTLGVSYHLEVVVFSFAFYVFHSLKRAFSAIAYYLAALADPLLYSFDIRLHQCMVNLCQLGFFTIRPQPKPDLFWSPIRCFLSSVWGLGLTVVLLHKQVFVEAIAMGHRSSQLQILTHLYEWIAFSPVISRASLAPSPKTFS